jgi:hypothetical protein
MRGKKDFECCLRGKDTVDWIGVGLESADSKSFHSLREQRLQDHKVFLSKRGLVNFFPALSYTKYTVLRRGLLKIYKGEV